MGDERGSHAAHSSGFPSWVMTGVRWAGDRWRRIGLIGLSSACALLALSFAQLYNDEPFFPSGWPVLFAAASVLLFAFMVRPQSDLLYRWSGSFTVTAFASRPVSTAARWTNGTVPSPRLTISIIVYTLLAFCLGWGWLREVKPWHIRHVAGVLARGD